MIWCPQTVQERPRIPVGTFGDVKTTSGLVHARSRYRDDNGRVRRVSAVGASRKAAERSLKASLALRGSCRVAKACLQLHGGYGYIWEQEICRMYAAARVAPFYGGTSEVMKGIVARTLQLS